MACFFNLRGGRHDIFVGLWLRMTFLEFHPKLRYVDPWGCAWMRGILAAFDLPRMKMTQVFRAKTVRLEAHVTQECN